MSALDGARLIFVDSGGKKSDDKSSDDTVEDWYRWHGYNCSVSTDGHKRAETSYASEHALN